jgi:RNA polymerase sigma-70 factor, ECF subfamily
LRSRILTRPSKISPAPKPLRNLSAAAQLYDTSSKFAGSVLNVFTEADERRLIEAAQQDPARFGELYERHFERVYAYVSRRVLNRAAAEDVTSEVFHHALANLPKYEWRGAPFGAWLMRIAANALADRWRRLAREQGSQDATECASAEPSPEEVQSRAQLFRLVDELPEDQRQVVRMRFAEEKSVKEIAVAIGRTEGAVKQLQFRGVAALRAAALATTRAGTPKQSGAKPGEAHG